MRIEFYADSGEKHTNIAIAKAMTESGFDPEDLEEIADYLKVFGEYHRIRLEKSADEEKRKAGYL